VNDPEPIAETSSPDPIQPVRYYLTPRGFRRLLESLILFLGIILFLRSVAVEPFGVPTGSMAPTLTGDHYSVNCPDCGHPIHVGKPLREEVFASSESSVDCPNCGYHAISLEELPLIVGDRLLVDKNSLTLRDPRRWEVVVFWCPVDSSKPYVKRVVSLPNEKVLLQGGDVWINGELSRKTLVEAKECLVPVMEMNHLPEQGWSSRWNLVETEPVPEEGVAVKWIVVDGREIRFEGSKEKHKLFLIEQVHRLFDERSQQLEERPMTDLFAYNPPQNHPYPVHDFYVSFDLEVLNKSGSFLCQLFDGRDRVSAELGVGAGGISRLNLEAVGTLRETDQERLRSGKTHRVEMAFIDRRVTVRVDGREAFKPLDLEPATNRNDVSRAVRLGTRGASCIVRNFRLSRDVHYRPQGDHAIGVAHELGDDEYFMLGDNSGNSDDSRSWRIPGVPRADIFGKPFLLHQPSKISRIQLGKRDIAFPWIDWSRIRWIR
jgi:signal peptidase I